MKAEIIGKSNILNLSNDNFTIFQEVGPKDRDVDF